MLRVFKYQLPIESYGAITIAAPFGAEWLCVQMQNGDPYVWARVNTKNTMMDHPLVLIPTGYSNAGTGLYIGTFQILTLVYHVFQEG